MSRTSDQPETSDATTPDAETTDSEALDADVAGLGYEEARDELSAIVALTHCLVVHYDRMLERGEELPAGTWWLGNPVSPWRRPDGDPAAAATPSREEA